MNLYFASQRAVKWASIVLFLLLLSSNSEIKLISAESDEISELDMELFDAVKNDDPKAAMAALKNGANINALSPRGKQTPLMQSVLHGKEMLVELFLENGADTSIPERDGYTPMHGAGFQGRAVIAEMLMKHGVGLRDKHKDGYEPAIRSCWGSESRHTRTVAFFLHNGVPLDDIYDTCMEMSKNEETKRMLSMMKSRSDEL